MEVENSEYVNNKELNKFVIKEYFRDLEIILC